MISKLEPYVLPKSKQDMLEHVFSQPPSISILEVYQERPKASILRNRIMYDLSVRDLEMNHHSPVIMETVLSSIQRSWDTYTRDSVTSNDFMRTPPGALYEVVAVEGKGRGMVASRDIKAGEIMLEDSPVILLPPDAANTILFLTLPRKALEAILLLHNAKPYNNCFTTAEDIPVHRLLDLISGVLDTNCFDGAGQYGSMGVLLLRGSLFNHSDAANLFHEWDETKEMYVFTARCDIKKGDELEINYVSPSFDPAARAEKLKNYGL